MQGETLLARSIIKKRVRGVNWGGFRLALAAEDNEPLAQASVFRYQLGFTSLQIREGPQHLGWSGGLCPGLKSGFIF